MAAIWTRTLGAATAAYSAVIMIYPELLARPCGFVERGERASEPARLLIRAIGARDVVIGAAMALAPAGRARTVATVCRAGADGGDALLFGALLPDSRTRIKVALVAGAWATACAAAGFTNR